MSQVLYGNFTELDPSKQLRRFGVCYDDLLNKGRSLDEIGNHFSKSMDRITTLIRALGVCGTLYSEEFPERSDGFEVTALSTEFVFLDDDPDYLRLDETPFLFTGFLSGFRVEPVKIRKETSTLMVPPRFWYHIVNVDDSGYEFLARVKNTKFVGQRAEAN